MDDDLEEKEKAIRFHEKFKREILENSNEKEDFKKACMEWNIISNYQEEQYRHCICSNRIMDCYVILNKINDNLLNPIGSSCIMHIFNAGNKVIKKELTRYNNLKKIQNGKGVQTIDKIKILPKNPHLIIKYCYNCFTIIRAKDDTANNKINFCKDCQCKFCIHVTEIVHLKREICKSICKKKFKRRIKNKINYKIFPEEFKKYEFKIMEVNMRNVFFIPKLKNVIKNKKLKIQEKTEKIKKKLQERELKKNKLELAKKGELTLYFNKYKKEFTFNEILKKDRNYCQYIYNIYDSNKSDYFKYFIYYLEHLN